MRVKDLRIFNTAMQTFGAKIPRLAMLARNDKPKVLLFHPYAPALQKQYRNRRVPFGTRLSAHCLEIIAQLESLAVDIKGYALFPIHFYFLIVSDQPYNHCQQQCHCTQQPIIGPAAHVCKSQKEQEGGTKQIAD